LPTLKDITKFCSVLNILLPKGWFCIKNKSRRDNECNII